MASLVLRAMFSTYYFVGNCKDFKEGVEICEDANRYSNQFCDKSLAAAGISQSKVAKKKVEPQTPGKLRNSDPSYMTFGTFKAPNLFEAPLGSSVNEAPHSTQDGAPKS